MQNTVLMDTAAINRTLSRLSHEILERNPNEDEIYLVGIKRRGVPLANRIAENIQKFSDKTVQVGEIDITLYRDDLTEVNEQPDIHMLTSTIPFDVKNRTVILVDDVIYTGRTARAAMEAVISFGRPACIQLAVLIDRGHRELPIRGDYVGKNVPTSKKEVISVKVPEFDGNLEVLLLKS